MDGDGMGPGGLYSGGGRKSYHFQLLRYGQTQQLLSFIFCVDAQIHTLTHSATCIHIHSHAVQRMNCLGGVFRPGKHRLTGSSYIHARAFPNRKEAAIYLPVCQ